MNIRISKLIDRMPCLKVGAATLALASICACSPKLDQKQYMTCAIAISVINYHPAVNALYAWEKGAGKKLADSVTPENGPALAQVIYAEHEGSMDKRSAFLADYNSSACRSIHGQEKLDR